MEDRQFMERALKLAEKGRGRTSPNPLVGCVIVRDGEIVGEGYHEQAGLPHAEINALKQAGDRAAGATMYVSLEPCNIHGRTPPCTDAIISAGIKKVVVATDDLNPKVAGKGMAVLKKAGIQVECGIFKDRARKLNESYNKYMTTGLPFVTLKVAMSLDGKIATKTGSSRWITGEEAREVVHRMRADSDAVLTGAGTVNADNPSLTARLDEEGIRQPVRVILSGDGSIDENSYVVTSARDLQTILFATEKITLRKKDRLEALGIEVVVIKSDKAYVSLRRVLAELGKRQIVSVMVEAGTALITAFIESGAYDKTVVFVAPKVIGGKDAPTFFAGSGISDIKDASVLKFSDIKKVGNDVMIEAYKK